MARYKLNTWFNFEKNETAGIGIDMLVNRKWCHVLNETNTGPLLLPTKAEARKRGREIVAAHNLVESSRLALEAMGITPDAINEMKSNLSL